MFQNWFQSKLHRSALERVEINSTGLSDFDKLVVTVSKATISKRKPRKIACRNYKNLDSLKFNTDLRNTW